MNFCMCFFFFGFCVIEMGGVSLEEQPTKDPGYEAEAEEEEDDIYDGSDGMHVAGSNRRMRNENNCDPYNFDNFGYDYMPMAIKNLAFANRAGLMGTTKLCFAWDGNKCNGKNFKLESAQVAEIMVYYYPKHNALKQNKNKTQGQSQGQGHEIQQLQGTQRRQSETDTMIEPIKKVIEFPFNWSLKEIWNKIRKMFDTEINEQNEANLLKTQETVINTATKSDNLKGIPVITVRSMQKSDVPYVYYAPSEIERQKMLQKEREAHFKKMGDIEMQERTNNKMKNLIKTVMNAGRRNDDTKQEKVVCNKCFLFWLCVFNFWVCVCGGLWFQQIQTIFNKKNEKKNTQKKVKITQKHVILSYIHTHMTDNK